MDASTDISRLKGIFLLKDSSLEPENYVIETTKKGIKITAPDHNGVFYAIQTLRQILPVGNYAGKAAQGKWAVPCGTISDGIRQSRILGSTRSTHSRLL